MHLLHRTFSSPFAPKFFMWCLKTSQCDVTWHHDVILWCLMSPHHRPCKVMLSIRVLCDDWLLLIIAFPCLAALSDKTHTIQDGREWGISHLWWRHGLPEWMTNHSSMHYCTTTSLIWDQTSLHSTCKILLTILTFDLRPWPTIPA